MSTQDTAESDALVSCTLRDFVGYFLRLGTLGFGGPIALVREGDSVTIDAARRELRINVAERELGARRTAWKAPPPRYTSGVLAKYARLVSSSSQGAVTDQVL